MVEPERQRLPRTARIHRSREIRTVLRQGTRKRTPTLDVYILPVASGRLPRVGWVVPKLGNGIVARNRVRRRLREIVRRRVLPTLRDRGHTADVLMRVRTRAYAATYHQIEQDVMSVVEAEW